MSVSFPAGPWIRTVFNWQNDEKNWQNDVWWKVTGTVPLHTDVNVVAADFDTALQPVFVEVITPQAQYSGVDLYLNNGSYTVAGHTNPAAAGTVSGGALPTEDAVIVTLNSGIATRAGVGRNFYSGIPETLVTDSRVNPTGVTAYNNIKTAMLALSTAGGVAFTLAVWSRKMAALEVASFGTVEAICGHRRKRRPRR